MTGGRNLGDLSFQQCHVALEALSGVQVVLEELRKKRTSSGSVRVSVAS